MKRELENKLKEMLLERGDHRVILLEGARQVGKSYLMTSILPGLGIPYSAFDLEKDSRFRHALEATVDFADFKALLMDRFGVRSGSILFIDEAQESRQLARYVKPLKEDWPEVKTVLTGSSLNRLFDGETGIPVGRTRSVCLYGFSFAEFVEYVHGPELASFLREAPPEVPPSRHALLLELYDAYLKVGGYPEAVKAYAAGGDYGNVIDEIISSLEEDFARKESYQPELFRTIIRGVSNNLGSPSKLTHFDATKYFAKKAIEAMRQWHILLEVEVSSLNPLHSDCLPKRYLHDAGVANRRRSLVAPTLSVLNTLDPAMRTPLGGLMENALLVNMIGGRSAAYETASWKKGDSIGVEVDFIFKAGDSSGTIPVECKAALAVKKKHFRSLVHYLKATGQHAGVLISAAPFERITAGPYTIVNVPIYLASEANIRTYLA